MHGVFGKGMRRESDKGYCYGLTDPVTMQTPSSCHSLWWEDDLRLAACCNIGYYGFFET